MENIKKKTFNWRETCKEKFNKYIEFQKEAKNETDIDKRNKLLSELRKININLTALKIIFEEERLDFHFLDKMQINDQQQLFDNIVKELDIEKHLT